MTIGVLALQGAFAKHASMLKALGVDHCEVRSNADLQACRGLIIPGGESTTMAKLLIRCEMLEQLHSFAQERPIFGTCAGLILMSKEVVEAPITPLGFLDIAVERNAYGRQRDSFVGQVDFDYSEIPIAGTFIRAPRIHSLGDRIKVIGRFKGEAVLIQQGRHLAASFHPELCNDTSVHQHFVELCHA